MLTLEAWTLSLLLTQSTAIHVDSWSVQSVVAPSSRTISPSPQIQASRWQSRCIHEITCMLYNFSLRSIALTCSWKCKPRTKDICVRVTSEADSRRMRKKLLDHKSGCIRYITCFPSSARASGDFCVLSNCVNAQHCVGNSVQHLTWEAEQKDTYLLLSLFLMDQGRTKLSVTLNIFFFCFP